jgi:putative ABC transport system ATP-binding protein
MASVLSFKDVSKQYKRGKESVAVLDHFNLEIAEKDFVAIMGPSGSGKTTLLNLIGGLDRPSAGEITVAGERLDRLSGSDLSKWRARDPRSKGCELRLAATVRRQGAVDG